MGLVGGIVMKLLQRIISILLLAFALIGQRTVQANILELLGEDFRNLPAEIGVIIEQYSSISHLLPSVVFDQILDVSAKNLQILDATFSPDGNAAVLLLSDKTFELWTRQPNGKFAFFQPLDIIIEIGGYKKASEYKIQFISDSNTIVIRPLPYLGRSCQLWTKKLNGQFIRLNMRNPNIQINNVEFSPDENIVVLVLSNNTCEVWTKRPNDQFTFSQAFDIQNQNPDMRVEGIKFSPDSNAVAIRLVNKGCFSPSYLNRATWKLWTKNAGGYQFTQLNIQNQNYRIDKVKFKKNVVAIMRSNAAPHDNIYELWIKQQLNDQFVLSHAFKNTWKIKFSPDGNAFISGKGNKCELWVKQQLSNQFVLFQTVNTKNPESSIRYLFFSRRGKFVFFRIPVGNYYCYEVWTRQANGYLTRLDLDFLDSKCLIRCVLLSSSEDVVAISLSHKWYDKNFDWKLLGKQPSDTQCFSERGLMQEWIDRAWSWLFPQPRQFNQPNIQNQNLFYDLRTTISSLKIEDVKFSGNTAALKLSNGTYQLYLTRTETLCNGKPTLRQMLFIKLLNKMKKSYLSTSLALIAHSCQRQGFNITLNELEEILLSFEPEDQFYLEKLFNIIGPKLYRKLKKLNGDNPLTENQIRFIRLLRKYNTSTNPKIILLSKLKVYYLSSKKQKDEQDLDLLEIFNNFSEEAKQVLEKQYRLQLHEPAHPE